MARPRHWVKNTVVFLAVVFGLKYQQADSWIAAGFAAIIFCVVSSIVYVINDIVDADSDKRHPFKKGRPIASGKISKKSAAVEAVILLVLAAVLASLTDRTVALAALAYLLLQIGYIFCFKFITLLDVICISLGFVIRAAAGALAVKVFISPWLFICMFTIFLFVGFCKRFNELAVISDNEKAHGHRRTLIAYTPELLTHLITLSAGIAVIAFLLYGLSERTVAQFGTNYFIYTLPLVVYAVFRFVMLSMKGSYTDPTDLILHDWPFQLVTTIWVIATFVIVYWGRNLHTLIQQLY